MSSSKQSLFCILVLGELGAAACSTPGIKTHGNSGGQSGSAGAGGSGGSPGPVFHVMDAAGLPDGSDGDGGVPSGVRGGGECGQQKYKIEKALPPEMMLVFDRSGSMIMPFGTSTRWKSATEALDVAVHDTEGAVLWGLKLFPTMQGCEVSAGVEVPVAINNYNGKMLPAISATSPNTGGHGTPTEFAVKAAADYLKTRTTPNSKYLLLATDGEPTCGDEAAVGAGAVAALAAARDAGFHTFVMGIATGDNPTTVGILNRMAESGGEPLDGDTKYYRVDNKADLATKLRQITGEVACTLPLNMAPPSPNDVAVNVDDMRVPRDQAHKEGWDYNTGMKSVQLYGKWCDLLLNAGGASVKTFTNANIIFGCPNVVIE